MSAGAPRPDGADDPRIARNAPSRFGASLERRLPLLILLLLVPTVLVLILWPRSVVRADLERSALERMSSCASEVEALLRLGLDLRLRGARYAAGREPVLAYLDAEPAERTALDEAARASLRAAMRTPPQIAELWSADGTLLLRETNAGPRDGETVSPLLDVEGQAPTAAGLQPLRLQRDVVFYDVVAEARQPALEDRPAGPVRGHLVLRRVFAETNGAAVLGRLIGRNAELRFGNDDGSLWTDLRTVASGPAAEMLTPGGRFFERADGVLRVGAGVPSLAPWAVWVEADAGDMLAPATNLAVQMGVLGIVVLALGTVGALWVSRRVTRPLREATGAAEAIAAGRYDGRLQVRSHDELGRLTVAFNTMAGRVERGRAELEQRVAARTADLEHALVQLRETQQDLVRKEKLALLGQLAGSVGHELRNPLGVMSNAAHYLELALHGAPPQVRSQLAVLRRQISLSEKITTDLLDFTRNRVVTAAAVPLDRLADEQLSRLGRVDATIVREFEAGAAAAHADAVHAGQVVFNLLTNAVQAIGQQPDGRIVVRVRQHGDRLRLEVEDNGPGVPDTLREKIFEPLFTTRERGIGLGLAVSRRLSLDNGGDLQLEVADGCRGARFVLTLPAAPLVQA